MKKILFVTISIFFTTHVIAEPAISKGGYFACKSQAYLRDMVNFIEDSNATSLNSYLSSAKCFFLEEGTKVSVIERTGPFKSDTRFTMFTVGGPMLWAENEAFDYNV